MAKKEIPVYELYIKDVDVEGLTAIGLVDQPAIEQNFFYFKKENVLNNTYQMANIKEEKRMIVGPALIPLKNIIRQDMFGELYYVQFSKELVSDLAHNFLKEQKLHLTTEQHVNPVRGIYMVESWITVNDKDKIYSEYGYSPEQVAIGSWCIQYHVENDDILQKIKAKQINGFSIEAYLSDRILTQSKMEKLLSDLELNKDEVIKEIMKMKKKD